MFHSILVAIDGSRASEGALEMAVHEAQTWKASLHIAYIVETGLFASVPLDNTVEVMYSMLEKEGACALEKAKEKAAEKGVTTAVYTRQGHAGSEILKLAQEVRADLIIMGSHGKSEVDRLLLGSVSSFVVSHSPVTTMGLRS